MLGKYLLRTWVGLATTCMALKSRLSAFSASSTNDGFPGGRCHHVLTEISACQFCPDRGRRCIPTMRGSAQYIREASVIMVATTCICCSLKPWALSIFKAWMDEPHEAGR